MLFTSFAFFVLLLITFVLYYLPVFAKYQISILIISSLVFYAYHQPVLVLLLLFSVSINIVSSYYVVYGNPSRRKQYAVAGVAANLTILLFFKYSPLFATTFFSDTSSVEEFLSMIPLPIGISFFTFQGISLVVDVYREKYAKGEELVPVSFITHCRNILLFKGFFPQLISGPIVKAHDFLPQIETKRYTDINWELIFKDLIKGYFLKMVVADNLKDFTFYISYPYFQGLSSFNLVFMLFGFSCQIFADFAGYSLIAIGLAKLFGYDFPQNFNFPYISTSFKEFWKRWHISLSSFLMEYLYFPLGGNRKGKLRTYFNLLLVMILGGLWHGAAWSYAVWGLFHGFALAVERALSGNKIKSGQRTVVKIIKGSFVFCSVTLAWLLFKLPVFSEAILYIKCVFSNFFLQDNPKSITYIMLFSFPVVLYHFVYLLKRRYVLLWMQKMEFAVYGCLFFLIIVNCGSPGAFIYFQF